jgi:ankyrin repeat protein
MQKFKIIAIPCMLWMLSSLASCNCQPLNSPQGSEKPTSSSASNPPSLPTNPSTVPPTITDEMMKAAESYNELVAILKKLRNHEQVDINKPTSNFNATPLLLASLIKGKEGAEIAQLFLNEGADPSIPNTIQVQPLYCAVSDGNIETVKVLIAAMQAKGHSLDFKNGFGRQTAYQAAESNHKLNDPNKKAYKEIMDLLEDAGADITL